MRLGVPGRFIGMSTRRARPPRRSRTGRTDTSTRTVRTLTGTGLINVALALLAWQFVGVDAGAVLLIALGLRIVAFVLASDPRALSLSRLV